ncbi:hypothetical protein V1507DRAFT_435666 [Lipomyces tetrasporus]
MLFTLCSSSWPVVSLMFQASSLATLSGSTFIHPIWVIGVGMGTRRTDFPIQEDFNTYRRLAVPDAAALDVWRVLNFPLSTYFSQILTSNRLSQAHESSVINRKFGSLRNLTWWNLSANQSVYLSLIPPTMKLFSIERDGTYSLEMEADVIRAADVYLMHPVNVIIQSKYPQIIYMSWEHNGVIIAGLEFKRPNSIKHSEWKNAITVYGPKRVMGNGLRIARQLKKYGYYARTPYMGAFDWNTLLLLKLGGNMEEWICSSNDPPDTPADGLDSMVRCEWHYFCFLWRLWKLAFLVDDRYERAILIENWGSGANLYCALVTEYCLLKVSHSNGR